MEAVTLMQMGTDEDLHWGRHSRNRRGDRSEKHQGEKSQQDLVTDCMCGMGAGREQMMWLNGIVKWKMEIKSTFLLLYDTLER